MRTEGKKALVSRKWICERTKGKAVQGLFLPSSGHQPWRGGHFSVLQTTLRGNVDRIGLLGEQLSLSLLAM
jgi:hypothetical protein